MPAKRSISYRDAGVSIDEADRAVSRIKTLARATFNRDVLTGIGSFGAAYQLRGWKRPVLISSADGVGTKLKVAFLAGKHDTVGEDLVNHCVNDIMVQGAEPLYFLDYFATGRLSSKVTAAVVSGLARGCSANGCALIGGETAEMPGFYEDGEYDLAVFIVGAVERRRLLTGSKVRAGDVLFGLRSNGLHTNGYSLARKLLFDVARYDVDTYLEELGCTIGEELLKVHRSYAAPLRALRDAHLLNGAAHITGGGITENTPRMLPDGLGVTINTKSWRVPAIFEVLRKLGNVPLADWRRTFNLGIGMIVATGVRRAAHAMHLMAGAGVDPVFVGRVVKAPASGRRVTYL